MKVRFTFGKTGLIFLALAVAACAHNANACRWGLPWNDVSVAMGSSVTFQPVFANQQQRGWRLYGTAESEKLKAVAISEGSLMTHICGVPANEVFINKGDICCVQDPSRQFEVRIRSGGKDRTLVIER